MENIFLGTPATKKKALSRMKSHHLICIRRHDEYSPKRGEGFQPQPVRPVN
jgi:hypothetical protein